jgi:hypothetical protein
MWRIVVFCAVAGLLGPAGAQGFPVAVLMKEKGRWRIVVSQNTDVVPAGG